MCTKSNKMRAVLKCERQNGPFCYYCLCCYCRRLAFAITWNTQLKCFKWFYIGLLHVCTAYECIWKKSEKKPRQQHRSQSMACMNQIYRAYWARWHTNLIYSFILFLWISRTWCKFYAFFYFFFSLLKCLNTSNAS